MSAKQDNAFFSPAFLDFATKGCSPEQLIPFERNDFCHLKTSEVSNRFVLAEQKYLSVTTLICFSGPSCSSPIDLISSICAMEPTIAAGFIQSRSNLSESTDGAGIFENDVLFSIIEPRTNYFIPLGMSFMELKQGMKRDSRYRVNKISKYLTESSLISNKNPENIKTFSELYKKTALRAGFAESYKFDVNDWSILLSSPLFHLVLIEVNGDVVSGAVLAKVQDGYEYLFMGYQDNYIDLGRLTLLASYRYASSLMSNPTAGKFYLGGGIQEGDALAKFKVSMGGTPSEFSRVKFVLKDKLKSEVNFSELKSAMEGRWP